MSFSEPHADLRYEPENFSKLVCEHAASVYILCYSITLDEVLAKKSLVQTFGMLLDTPHAESDNHVSEKLNTLAVKAALKNKSGREVSPVQDPIGQAFDNEVWKILHQLGWKERLLCATHFGLAWPVEKSARLLGLDANSLKREVQLLEKSISQSVDRIKKPNEITSKKTDISASLSRLFIQPVFTEYELSDFIYQAQQNRKSIPRPNWRKWVGIVFACCTFLGLVLASFFVFFNRDNKLSAEEERAFSTQNSQGTFNLTPQSSTKGIRPLRWYSRSNAIKQKLFESSQLWTNLYMDIEMIDYGPDGYIGAPRIFRSQAWVSQPEQSIILFGLQNHAPSNVYMWSSGRNFYLNPVTGESYSNEIEPSPLTLILKPEIRQMIFPTTSKWVQDGTTLQVQDTDIAAGKSALVVDHFDRFGGRDYRLWLEPESGIVLRAQEFGGPKWDILLKDYVVTDLQVGQSFPPASLISAIQDVGEPRPLAAATPAPSLGKRIPPVPVPAPAFLDLSKARLTFQFANNLETSSQISETLDNPVRLFADGYFLADTYFGLPWMLHCDRSLDGFRIAFNSDSDGTSIPDASLRWFDLRKPTTVYQAVPSIIIDEFAFSKDGSRIAIIGKDKITGQSGLYLLDLPSGEVRSILSIDQGRSLVWSPDQESLAIIGRLNSSEATEALLIHIRTGLVAYQGPLPENGDSSLDAWPMANWGVEFPKVMGGMENCIAPPTE